MPSRACVHSCVAPTVKQCGYEEEKWKMKTILKTYKKRYTSGFCWSHENDFQINRAAGFFMSNKHGTLVVDIHYYDTRDHRNALFQQR